MIEAASSAVNTPITNKLLNPYYLLQYADDTLVFSTCKGNASAALSNVLNTFSSVSGININVPKSAIIPFNLSASETDSLQTTFTCKISMLPLTYLGLPLTLHRPGRAAFQALIDKIQGRLQGWKRPLMSRAGRLVLASSVLSSIPIFYMSVFKLPGWVIKAIDRIRRQFIWGASSAGKPGIALLSWDRVCLPKTAGDLGLQNLHLQNIALLLKWWWRIYHLPDSQWHLITKLLYGKRDHNIPPLCWKKDGSFFWKDLLSMRFYFQWSTTSEVHSGKQTLFWYDDWGGTRLAYYGGGAAPPSRSSISLIKAIPIWHQLLPLPMTQTQHSLLEKANLLSFTQDRDRIVWRWTSNGIYTAASAYRALSMAGKQSFPLTGIWKLKVTPSIRCFLILLALNRVLTQEQLQRRKISFHEECLMCNQKICETATHLFLTCPFSLAVWRKLTISMGIPSVPNNCNCLQAMLQLFKNSAPFTFKDTVIATTFWGLWLERNNRIFREEVRSLDAIHDWIIREATFFMKYC
ncbi:RNA-directed DNA polymerase (reverse transcriptase)-related family protein [Rhynchospora pubera]|uniref:RNA-directed DNA polymerase (Reverse transcriptase)-related family protein n=1 Tax=Rhynchospora pubera TaxID=906938 RepID=A0AAV8CXT1_9POAL|nr:RNA-directed DNA polymerase (reverse transcriptase)-related family protein [Rhynchospora pubera]